MSAKRKRTSVKGLWRKAGKKVEGRADAAAPKIASAKSIVGRVAIAALAVAVCILPPLFVNDVIGYLPLLALLLVGILSFVYLQVLKHSLSFSEESLVSSCERGSEIDFVLDFKNSAPLVFLHLEVQVYVSDLFGAMDVVTPVPLVIMPFENKEFRFQASFDHIGTYAAGVQKLFIGDLLGLFTHTIVNENRHKVEVLPRLFEADEVPLSSEVSSESQKPRQALTVDDMDYAGVREYAWGDPIKTIHWKLSAREPNGDYLTRLFETFDNPGLAIVIDTSSPSYDSESLMCIFDGIVESALSVNQYAVSKGIDSFIAFRNTANEDVSIRVAGMQDFPDFAHALPRIEPGEGMAARELLRRELNTLHGQDNVAFCTAHVDEEALSTLVSLKLRKRNPVLFVVVPPSMDSEETKEYVRPLRRLDEAQVPYFVLSSASQLGVEGGGTE